MCTLNFKYKIIKLPLITNPPDSLHIRSEPVTPIICKGRLIVISSLSTIFIKKLVSKGRKDY